MTTAIYPGSFDPVTYGHIDVIRRASRIFDRVVIGVLYNKTKKPVFSVEEKIDMIQEVTKDLDNIEVVAFGGLLVDFCKKIDANVIVRGIRAVSDFEYELMMAQTNHKLDKGIETMFFATNAKYSFLSSSTVRELAYFGGDISSFVPPYVEQKTLAKFKELNP
ncbi:MAG: pantetheine-phosphate adenylyltransferase [Lachnospiraceae bacterium]|nr:pantetheine-phosphate adenylyltransferase [Lachnospiraceae bacterium]